MAGRGESRLVYKINNLLRETTITLYYIPNSFKTINNGKNETKTVHHNTVKKAIKDIRCVNRAHNTHINALRRVGKNDLPNKWHQMEGLLNMKGTKTEYLVQWAGRQENGEPWPPTWEPQKQIARAHERQFNLRCRT